MKKYIFSFFAVLLFLACSHKITSAASNAPAEKPKADANALYVSDVKAIMETRCSPCHIPDKGGHKLALDNFNAVQTNIDDILMRVQLDPSDPKYMPFKGKKDPLTAAEISSLKAWKDALGQK